MDRISAPEQNRILGGIANLLRKIEQDSGPEFLPRSLDVMGLVRQLALPSAETVEKLSYGDPLFRMPTQSNIPITTDRGYLAEVLGMAPVVPAASRATTRISNEMADQLVKVITRNPEATAPRVLEETAMPFMQAVAPKGASTSVPQSVNLQMAREAAESLGMSPDEQVRMLQMGFEPGWYHGTTGDIEKFRLDLLGEATGAQSAKKGFFFARDPANPPADFDPQSLEPGSGPRTASGYSLIGGDREYREAMRKASLAEKKQDWDEYEKQMGIAEDFAIKRLQNSQLLVAKYGEARDVMLDKVQNAFFNKKLPQAEAEALDARFRELMPYGWYNQFEPQQFEVVKQAIREIAPNKQAKDAEKAIDEFIKVKNERALDEKTQSGSNVLPVALSYKNPLVYDFKGSAYREETYSDLVDQAIRGGNDAVILKNTFDPGAGKAELVDVGVVFDPSQIRSKFAAFDPTRTKESDILAGSAGVGGAGLLGAGMYQDEQMY